MAETFNVIELADSIQRSVHQLHNILQAANQPCPSFDIDAPTTDFDVLGAQDVRSSLLDRIDELRDLLLTPVELIQRTSPTDWTSRHALDHFKVYDLIPVGETKTYDDLAASMGLPIPIVRTIFRHAMLQRIFHEPSPGVVAHTPASKVLTENIHVQDYVGTVCKLIYPAAAHTAYALERFKKDAGDKDVGKSGFQVAFGKDYRQFLAGDDEAQRRYDSAMNSRQHEKSYSIEHIANGFDWSGLGNGTVVDVAGGIGTVSRQLAKSFPRLNFIVQDLEAVVSKATFAPAEEEIKPRISFTPHDIFTPNPAQHADVYFFRRVIMEWPDEKAVEILRNLIHALQPGKSKVVIADPYLPDPGSGPRWQETKFRGSDMLALALCNARSRDPEAFKELFRRASSGFRVLSVKALQGSDMMITEALWEGE